jgi:hypothetical protein
VIKRCITPLEQSGSRDGEGPIEVQAMAYIINALINGVPHEWVPRPDHDHSIIEVSQRVRVVQIIPVTTQDEIVAIVEDIIDGHPTDELVIKVTTAIDIEEAVSEKIGAEGSWAQPQIILDVLGKMLTHKREALCVSKENVSISGV